MSTILLIRHGESEAFGYIAGRTDGIHLSPKGRKEAEEMGNVLTNFKIDMFYTSPITRTLETTEIITGILRKDYKLDEEFLEVDFGEWTGRKFSELKNDPGWKMFNTFRTGTLIPGGEIISQVQTRMITEIEKLNNEFPGKTIAIVSHGDPIRSAICYYSGIPLDFMTRITVSTASLSIIDINTWGPVVQCVNFTPGVRILRDVEGFK